MNRIRLIIFPLLTGVAGALVLASASWFLWENMGHTASALKDQTRLEDDNRYLDNAMNLLRGDYILPVIGQLTLLLIVVLGFWHVDCWRRKIAFPGLAVKFRKRWWLLLLFHFITLMIILLRQVLVIGGDFVRVKESLDRFTVPYLTTLGIVGSVLFIIGFPIFSWLTTHKIYRPGVPLGSLRPW